MIKKALKKIFPGVSWKNPITNMVFHILNPVDYFIRSMRGWSYLPRYSVRIRSNGVSSQFGGRNFIRLGNLLANLLQDSAKLNAESKVLEIGCGCGRTAYALSEILDTGEFVGVDIDRESLEACKQSAALKRDNFIFDYLDVQNDEYNPEGKISADTYQFPYEDNRFDVIFLVSVFTHMLTDDVKNYVKEISRLLKPGGICMISTFLVDKGRETNNFSFPYNEKDHYYFDKVLPEIAVGYHSDFFKKEFSENNLTQLDETKWGSWRNNAEVKSTSGFSQDILLFSKN